MGWLFVLLASVSEIAGVMGLKMYSNKKNAQHAALYFGGFALSFIFLYQSFNYLQVSVSYAVWIGIGTAGAVLINMFIFGETKSAQRFISVIIIVIGVVGLKAVS